MVGLKHFYYINYVLISHLSSACMIILLYIVLLYQFVLYSSPLIVIVFIFCINVMCNWICSCSIIRHVILVK